MFDYSQPDFYHFADDSISLSSFAALKMANNAPITCGADFFAGCGVVGMEFLVRYSKPVIFDFYEQQESFYVHFMRNSKILPSEICELVSWKSGNLLSLESNMPKYSLILANPPFYDQEKHRTSSRGGESRRLCRSWSDSERKQFLAVLASSLDSKGRAFILLRPQTAMLLLLQQSNELSIVELTAVGKSLIAEVCLNIK